MLETADAGVVSRKVCQQLPAAFGWSDLVLPPSEEQLLAVTAEFAERVRQAASRPSIRPRGEKRTILALFCGPASIGKTMAAQTLAHELRLGVIEANLKPVLDQFDRVIEFSLPGRADREADRRRQLAETCGRALPVRGGDAERRGAAEREKVFSRRTWSPCAE